MQITYNFELVSNTFIVMATQRVHVFPTNVHVLNIFENAMNYVGQCLAPAGTVQRSLCG